MGQLLNLLFIHPCFPFKGKPTLPANFEEDTWAKLRSAICAIFLKQPDSCDLEKLYQVIMEILLLLLLLVIWLV